MTTGGGGDGGLAVALVQLAQFAERLDEAERMLADHGVLLDELAPADGEAPAAAAAGTAKPYRPRPAPRWWLLKGQERADALDHLRAWVEQVYRPGYGHLAAMLPACWEQHPACLYALDWLSELWSVLYLTPRRAVGHLSAQAEWQTRLLAAAADQMARETAGCRHRAGASS